MYAISGQNNVVVGQMNTTIVDWQTFVMLLIIMTLQENPTPVLKATKSMFMTACPHYNSTKHFNFWATNNIVYVDSILTISKHGPYCNTFNNHNTFDSRSIIDFPPIYYMKSSNSSQLFRCSTWTKDGL